MKGKITKGNRKDSSNEPDAIDKLETIASTAIEVYRVIKPVAKQSLKIDKKVTMRRDACRDRRRS